MDGAIVTVAAQLVAGCLAAILALPVPWFHPRKPRPESAAERKARVEMVIEEVVAESYAVVKDHPKWERRTGWKVVDLVAMGVAQGYSESAFAYEVHSGMPWPGRPSPFGDKGRAACLWQLQVSVAEVPFDEWRPFEKDQWSGLTGTDRAATRRCARAGVRTIAYHAWRCRTPLRKFNKRTDHRWPAAHVLAEYNRPRPWKRRCNRVTSQSIRWAALYHQVRKTIYAELRREGQP